MLEIVRELKLLGIGVYFEKENIHSLSGDSELMLAILASYAQEESRSVSENCKWRNHIQHYKAELAWAEQSQNRLKEEKANGEGQSH